MDEKVGIVIRYQCQCGAFLLEEDEESHRKVCLPYLVNGRLSDQLSCEFSYSYRPKFPVTNLLTNIKYEDPLAGDQTKAKT